jgi:hypothetical protein
MQVLVALWYWMYMILMFCFLRGGICGMVALCWVVEINIYIYIYIYILPREMN